MLTGKQVRVRIVRTKVVPLYIDPTDETMLETAERLLELFRGMQGQARGEIEAELDELLAESPHQPIIQGLAKLLEDRGEFEVQAPHPPDQLREAVFRAATAARTSPTGFQRATVLADVARTLHTTADAIERGLFADLKSEQLLTKFDDLTPTRLLERYNLALAQAVLFRASGVEVVVRGEAAARYRHLFRILKFHRLLFEVESMPGDRYKLRIDGPLSLFSATQKYGVQLAFCLPHLINCKDFELKAELRWGTERKEKQFTLTSKDGLKSSVPNTPNYVPDELHLFTEAFTKKAAVWDITEAATLVPLGNSIWVPDFQLTHRPTGTKVWLEVLGYWRKASAEQHLRRLLAQPNLPFVLAVSEQLHIADETLDALPTQIHKFKTMPLPDEVIRLAMAFVPR